MPSGMTRSNLGLNRGGVAIYLFLISTTFPGVTRQRLPISHPAPSPVVLLNRTRRPNPHSKGRVRRSVLRLDVRQIPPHRATRNQLQTDRFTPASLAPRPRRRQKTRRERRRVGGKGRGEGGGKERAQMRNSLLPRALLVAMRLQALTALVLVHLQTTLLFEIAHK